MKTKIIINYCNKTVILLMYLPHEPNLGSISKLLQDAGELALDGLLLLHQDVKLSGLAAALVLLLQQPAQHSL